MSVLSVSRLQMGATLVVRAHGTLLPDEVPRLAPEAALTPDILRVQIDLHGAQLGLPAIAALVRLAALARVPVDVLPDLVRQTVERAAVEVLAPGAAGGGPGAASGVPVRLFVVDSEDRVRFMNTEARAETAGRTIQREPPWAAVRPDGRDPVPDVRRGGTPVRERSRDGGLLLAGPLPGDNVVVCLVPRATQEPQGERRQTLIRMAAAAAHEIRNPLAAIRAGIELLQGRLGGSIEAATLAVMLREIDRLTRLLDQYLTLSRPAAVGPVGLAPVLAGCVQFLGQDPRADGVAVGLREIGAPATVIADPERLRQVFLNVLGNAIEAVGGDGAVAVEIVRNDDSGEVAAHIRDSGPGFPEAVLATPFVPFRTTKPSGTGLGLVISGEIVAASGGRIELRNATPGPGAEVVVVLPLAPPAE